MGWTDAAVQSSMDKNVPVSMTASDLDESSTRHPIPVAPTPEGRSCFHFATMDEAMMKAVEFDQLHRCPFRLPPSCA